MITAGVCRPRGPQPAHEVEPVLVLQLELDEQQVDAPAVEQLQRRGAARCVSGDPKLGVGQGVGQPGAHDRVVVDDQELDRSDWHVNEGSARRYMLRSRDCQAA